MSTALLLAVLAAPDERAPPPRPASAPAVAALTAFLDDLRRGDPAAAHARVGGWQESALADQRAFVQHWERMTRWYGKLLSVGTVEGGDPAVGAVDVRFERHTFACGAGAKLRPNGKLDHLHLNPYPQGRQNLLWAGHGIRVAPEAPDRPADGLVTFAVPGLHREQVPLSLTLAADPPEALRGYKLRRRADGLNWVLEATVRPPKTGATVFWEATVLARPEEHKLFGPATWPTDPEVPPAAAPWTRPTACVQSDDQAVRDRAFALRKKHDAIGSYAGEVATWVSKNRGTGKPFRTLDAAAAMGCGGSCTSRANLAAALLRARGVPARTVAHLPGWAGYHYVHWLTEYWQPGLGWHWIEPSKGSTWCDEGNLVVLNVATPDDEDESVWANRRSGVMSGAPRLSSREIDGPVRTAGVLGSDLRCWGLSVPLARLDAPEADLDLLWKRARAAHPRLRVNDPRRDALARVAQTAGVAGLTEAVKRLD